MDESASSDDSEMGEIRFLAVEVFRASPCLLQRAEHGSGDASQ